MTSAFYRFGAQASATPTSEVTETALDFPRLFGQYGGYVIGLLRRLGVRSADVQDVAQDVFVVVHRKLPEFEGRSSAKTWICGIAAHLAANYRRRAYHRREELAVDTERAGPAYDAWATVDERAALLSALDALDPKQRDVFVLHEVEELPMADVTAIVGCPLFTGYTRLRAARKALQVELRKRGYGEDDHE